MVDEAFGKVFQCLENNELLDNTVIIFTSDHGEMLQDKSPDFAVCHADIHLANVLVDAKDKLHVVDWDQPILAPRERDLMFVTVGGFMTDLRDERSFFRGYGETEIDPVVMAYYRYERAMQDLAEFADDVFLGDRSDATRQDSINRFMAQFSPGGLVEAAQKLDHVVPKIV